MTRTYKTDLGRRSLKAKKSNLGFGQGHWGAMKSLGAERMLRITMDNVSWIYPGHLQT